jgi:ParB family chromosome partitioning protein
MTKRSARNIAVTELVANPANIRSDVGDVTELARAIKRQGVLSPLLVTEDPYHRGWLLLAGHRRLAAARQAELHAVPCFIHHDVGSNTAEQLVLMLMENVQRKNLSPIEKARAYGKLRDGGLTPSDIARRTGIAVSSVHTHLALLDLDAESMAQVEAGTIPAGDAIAAVREERQRRRQAEGMSLRGRPVVVEPPHFDGTHPLIAQVSRICGHTTRPKLGNTGCCGECWEAVIRADALGDAMPPAEFDEVVVEHLVNGNTNVHASPCDRVEVVRRWLAAGRSLTELATRTGWKVERYVLAAVDQEAAS